MSCAILGDASTHSKKGIQIQKRIVHIVTVFQSFLPIKNLWCKAAKNYLFNYIKGKVRKKE
jgi:hypothetical protein